MKPTFDVQSVVNELSFVRQAWRVSRQRTTEPGGRELPSREALSSIIVGLRGVLFPMRLGPHDLRQENEDFYVGYTLDTVLHALWQQVVLELSYTSKHLQSEQKEGDIESRAQALVSEFSLSLPEVRSLLDSDVIAAYEGDPAARSVDEVLLCYPGIEAMIHHRLAHRLYKLNLPLLARLVSELAHAQTGIDIHPGASIGSGFFIDHGTGVVIGETAVIGKRVRIYQAVTLGAKRFPTDSNGHPIKGQPRHPVLQDDVVIYAGATVLGCVTIGQGATIGGNVWVTHDVAPGTHLTQARSLRDEHSSSVS